MGADMQLAFYKGRTRLFDRAVQWWTRSPYSHCELVLSTDSRGVATCASSSYIDGGVRIKHIALDPAKWDVIDLAGFDAARSAKWFDAHAGQRYDLAGLLGFVLPFTRDDTTRWFCSEACAAALALSDPWRYSPGSLAALIASINRPDNKEKS